MKNSILGLGYQSQTKEITCLAALLVSNTQINLLYPLDSLAQATITSKKIHRKEQRSAITVLNPMTEQS